MYNPSNFWGALQRGRGCVTPKHSLLKTKAVTRSQETPPHQTVAKTSQPMPRPSPSRTPQSPLKRGNLHATNHSLPTRKQRPNLPSREGSGVCDPRAKPPQTQNGHPKPKKHHLAKQRQKHFSPHRTSHRNTPLNPLSRGETYTP